MRIPARLAWIVFESPYVKTGKVPPGTLRVYCQDNPRINDFDQRWLASGPRPGNEAFAVANILSLFRHLTVFEGLSPQIVDRVFMQIAEYADHVSDELAGFGAS